MFTLPTGKSFSHWLSGSVGYEAGDGYTVTGNASFTAVLTDNIMTLSSDGEGGYFVNMPQTESYTLDISDQSVGFSFKLYDNGGSNYYYSDNCDGTLLITAPHGTVLFVSGSGEIEKIYDWLIFYEGDSATVLGEDKYNGSFSIDGLLTAGNELKVCFHSDEMSVRDGFALSVAVADPALIPTLTFVYDGNEKTDVVPGGAAYELPAFESLFTLPERKIFIGWQIGEDVYDEGDVIVPTEDMTITAIVEDEPDMIPDGEGGFYSKIPSSDTLDIDLSDKALGFTLKVYDNGGPDGAYASNCDGYLRLTAPSGYSFAVSGSGRTVNTSDYLTLYDGDTSTVLGADKYYGTFTLEETVTDSEVLILYFGSDGSNTALGVDLTVRIVDPSALAAVRFAFEGTEKSITASVGGDVILPAFTDYFTLATGATFVGWKYGGEVYDAGDVVTVTGNMTFTAEIEYPDALMFDGEGGYYALVPTVGTIPLDLSGKSAGFTFTVYDDGGPDDKYSNSGNSYLAITAPAGMIFSVFGSGKGESTSFDWITFYDGDTDTVLGSSKYGGTSYTVEELVTTGNVLIICSKTDSSQNYDGFALTVTMLDAANIATVSFVCGETKTVTVQKGETFILPQFTALFTMPDGKMFNGWECGGSVYAAGASYNVTGDTTFTADIADEPDLIPDGNGGWYTKFLRTSNRSIDLSDKSSGFTFKVYDDGGPNDQYSNNCSNYLTLTAPAGMIFSVSGSGKGESSSYDWLTFYDGDTDTVLGNAKYGGKNYTVEELTTTGNVLIIYYKTDSMTVNDGFELTVTIIDTENIATITFVYGEETKTEAVLKGEDYNLPEFTTLFTLPDGKLFGGWKRGGSVYLAGYSYNVTGDLTFTADIQDEPDLIPDGNGGWYTKFWTTDRSIDLTGKPSGFTFKVYDNGGPGGKYSNNCNSFLILTASEGMILSVSGSGKGESTSYDWLTFYDGDVEAVLGSDKYGGTTYTIGELTTDGNVLIIYFKSDNSQNYDGFELTVTIYDPVSIATFTFVCEGETETATVQKGDSFELPPFTSLFTLPEGKLFTGWQNGENVYAPGDSFNVTGDTTFTAVFADEPAILSDGEGGFYAKVPSVITRFADISDKGAGFVLKVYDAGGPDGKYVNDSSGFLVITAPADATLTVSGTGVGGDTVSYDWLTFYDGDLDTVLGNDKYGGKNEYAVEELTTTGNVLIIYFKSDNSVNADGFELTVTVNGAPACFDLNGDHTTSVSDVSTLLDAIAAGDDDAKYDLNADGDITVADVSALLDFIAGGCSHARVIEVDEIPSTCVEHGVSAYSYCAVCGEYFEEPEELPFGAHDFFVGECTVCGETISAGDVTKFGIYEQDNNLLNGQESIEWIVLTVEDGQALLLSKYALDAKAFDDDSTDGRAWESCTLRTWLNGTFYDAAFDDADKEMIIFADTYNAENPNYDTANGDDTQDYVFIPSVSAVTNPDYGFPDDPAFCDERLCYATLYAEANGCDVSTDEGCEHVCCWWLRMKGYDEHCAVGVGPDGTIVYSGIADLDETTIGVRPAIWIALD